MDDTPLLVIGWIALALLTCGIGGARGYSAILWLVAGFLLGPIALVVLIAMPINHEALQEKAVKNLTAKRCPRCTEAVRMQATLCKYCGTELTINPPLTVS